MSAGAAPLLRRVLSDPRTALRAGRALLRGHACRLACRLSGRRFSAGANLRIYGSLRVRGPGTVVFGDDVTILDTVTPYTHAAGARIVVGNDVLMGGTQLGCVREIRIDDHCMLANASIMDSDFHSLGADRHDPAAPVRVAPVHIGENVWVSRNVGILPGVRIGRDSVVGFGAVCTHDYPAGMLIAGNPARALRPIPPGSGDVVEAAP